MMFLAALIALLSVIATVVRLALEKEYQWWAAKVASAMVRLAARVQPRSERVRRSDEWLGELDELNRDGTAGLLWAVGVLVGSPRTRWELRRSLVRGEKRRETWGSHVRAWIFPGAVVLAISLFHPPLLPPFGLLTTLNVIWTVCALGTGAYFLRRREQKVADKVRNARDRAP